jgi:hypothetical protein
MASCDYCGETVRFIGTKLGRRLYCNKLCAERGRNLLDSQPIPEHEVHQHVLSVHQGSCPICGGVGPVDVYKSYMVWSVMMITCCSSAPEVCCRSCGRKLQLGAAAYCLVFGWLGPRLGLILLGAAAFSSVFGWWGPFLGWSLMLVQIVRNLLGMILGPDPQTPSPALETYVRHRMGSRLLIFFLVFPVYFSQKMRPVPRVLPEPGRTPARGKPKPSSTPAYVVRVDFKRGTVPGPVPLTVRIDPSVSGISS